MTRRVPMMALLVALLFSSLFSTAVSAETALQLPDTMAAVGDSVTQAASTGGSLGADAPQNSWSTGTSSTVNSHYLRLLALGAPVSGQNNNRSVSGAKMAGLNTQMATLADLDPDYLTVLIGGNDLCTDTVAQMTSVEDFRAQFAAAMATLATGSPGTHVYVVTIPDVYQLWNLFKGDWWARFIWSAGGICQSLLANPTSTQLVDVQRREQVRQRNIDYNTQLAQVCAAYTSTCRFDNNAVFDTQFTKSDVSADYFHPSIAGQAKLAAVSWSAGYAWATTPPPNVAPTASFTSTCVDLTCTFADTSTDPDGTIVVRAWDFGDAGTSGVATVSHTYAAAGTYSVGLTVTDNAGATATTSSSVTVVTPAPTQMWIAGLTGSATATRNSWAAMVRVSVVGPSPVSGVTVTGTWAAGSGATSCTTGTDGTCTLKSSQLSKKSVPSVTFAVSGLTKSGWAYDPARSTSTSITVLKP